MSNFDWDRSYKDLCTEIEILEIRQDSLLAELRIIRRRIHNANAPRTKLVANYSGMPGGGSDGTHYTQAIAELQRIEAAIEDVSDILSLKHEAKRRMEERMSQFDKLEYRVAYLRDVERKSIAAISIELGYSYDWIAKISSRLKRVRKAAETA